MNNVFISSFCIQNATSCLLWCVITCWYQHEMYTSVQSHSLQTKHNNVRYLNSTIISVCDCFIHIVLVHHQKYTHSKLAHLVLFTRLTPFPIGLLVNSQYFAITSIKLLSGMMHPGQAVLYVSFFVVGHMYFSHISGILWFLHTVFRNNTVIQRLCGQLYTVPMWKLNESPVACYQYMHYSS
jgi:hypothetical protein